MSIQKTKDLQRRMANAGLYFGAIDGVDGPKTQEALKHFDTNKDDERYIFSDVLWNPTQNYDFKKTKPELVVIHYTACPAYVAISGFKRVQKKGNRSAHYVIDTAGNVTQMVTETNRAWHAGASSYKGRSDCNSFSIGIELENWGPLAVVKGSTFTYTGDPFKGAVDEVNGKLWHAYDWVQVEACAALVASIKHRHKISDVVGHEHVSPGRKIDPGPAFPWKEFTELVSGYQQKLEEA